MPAELDEKVSLSDATGLIASGFRDLVGDVLELAALETRSAGRAVAAIVALAGGVAFCAIAAWVLVWAALAAGLAQWGLGWGWALLLVALLNVVGGAVLAYVIVRLSRRLTFAATRKALSLGPSSAVETAHASEAA